MFPSGKTGKIIGVGAHEVANCATGMSLFHILERNVEMFVTAKRRTGGNDTPMRIFHVWLWDVWYFTLLQGARTWLQGNTRVFKYLLSVLSHPNPLFCFSQLLVECNFCQFKF